MKRKLYPKGLLSLLLLLVSFLASAKTTYNKGTVTIYVGQEQTFYHNLSSTISVSSSGWFLRQTSGNSWSDSQEDWCYKIVSKNSQSCTVKGLADNSKSSAKYELHFLSEYETYECYWTIIVKSSGSIYVDADPSFGNWNNPTMVQAESKVYLTARTSDGSSASGANIYYTTDGSDANENSTLYTSSGITINKKTYISAIASKNGYSPVICGGYYDVYTKVTSITLNKTSLSLETGQSETLTATVKPDNATDKSVTWSSSNTNIVTVTSNGKVTAVSAGSATITCKANDGSGVQETCAVTVKAVGIEINETNFPDKNFRNYLLNQSYGKDGVLTDEEINGITELFVDDKNIDNLKGIEYFTALTWLRCTNNNLTTLDVSKNTTLIELWCHRNQLTSLDVSKNSELKLLSCFSNNLTTLDVTKNSKLFFLQCGTNQLVNLNITNNVLLGQLSCQENKLTSLDVSKNTALTNLSCYSNQLTTLNVSKNTALKELACGFNQLSSLDVSNNTALTTLNCSFNKLSSLDVSKNMALNYLLCDANQILYLDLSSNTELERVICSTNQIKGTAMDNLITSLPRNTTSAVHQFCCIDPKNKNEGNVCTMAQVAAVKAKGWFPCYWDIYNGEYVEYEGGDPAVPESISLSAQTSIAAGQTITLTPEVTPSNAEYTLTWSSDDETVATVNQDGVVTGVKKGKTFINVETDNGKAAYCKLTVTAAEPVSIDLPKTATVYVGGTLTLTPTITPEGAETTLTWTSDDESVARISANGVLTGVAEGLALVTVSTSNGLTSNACKVKVEPDPSGISTVMMDEKTGVPIYTPSGQRLSAPRKGINIVGGKKVIVR